MTRNQIGPKHLALVDETNFTTRLASSQGSHPSRGYDATLNGTPLRQDAQEDLAWTERHQSQGGSTSGPSDRLPFRS